MILTLHALKDTDKVCIVGSGIPGGQYLGSCDPVAMGHIIVQYMAADRSGPCSMSVEMANIATKPSSRDNGLVARLSIST